MNIKYSLSAYMKFVVIAAALSLLIFFGAATTVTSTAGVTMSMKNDATTTTVISGTMVNYTYDVQNTGDVTLTGITVKDDKCSQVYCIGTELQQGVTMSCTCSMRLTESTTNTATVTGTAPDGSTVTDTDTMFLKVIYPSMKVTKTASPSEIFPGTPTSVTYTYTITNTGDSILVLDPGIAVCDNKYIGDFEEKCQNGEGLIRINENMAIILQLGESVTFERTVIISDDITNVVTVTATVDEASDWITATASATVVTVTGRMTGGGSVFMSDGTRVTHGFELHCDARIVPNNLEINWGNGPGNLHKASNQFHLENLVSAWCMDDPAIENKPPYAPIDTYYGYGYGRYNGVSGAWAEWTFTDAGEPGKDDMATITIWDANGKIVLTVSGKLQFGNQQAHVEHKKV